MQSGTFRKTPIQKALRWALYLLYLAVLGWFSIKVFWKQQAGVPLTGEPDVSHVWQFFYPELVRSGVLDKLTHPQRSGDAGVPFRIVLLGGSVLEQVEPKLRTELERRFGGGQIELFGLSSSARTSRDSFLKYQYLLEQGFECDLVIFYHGINDVRMNCCPEADFRRDYTHGAFYKSLAKRVEAGTINLRTVVGEYVDNSIPLGEPDEEYRAYGSLVKTRGAFKDNTKGIVQLARERGQTVLLMSFAHHLPENYTRKDFEAERLDYAAGQYGMVVESWGNPSGVRDGIEVHNEVIRDVASSSSTLFVDQHAELLTDPASFSDVCHLSDRGLDRFVENLMPVIVKQMATARE